MSAFKIIVLIVLIILTFIIFTLTWLAFYSLIKSYRLETNLGKRDEEIKKEYFSKQKKKKTKAIIGWIFSGLTFATLTSLFITGIVYTANNETLMINNKTILVIKSNSMSEFYDDDYALKYGNNTSLHFDFADICKFEKVSLDEELIIGEVYGYKLNSDIIVHRLIAIHPSGYEFRGDANPVSDFESSKRLVSKENIIYHYTGEKIQAIGAFILYSQSMFGMWSICGIVGVIVCTEIAYQMVIKINKKRIEEITHET